MVNKKETAMTAFDIDPKGYLPLIRLIIAKLRNRAAPENPKPGNAACCA